MHICHGLVQKIGCPCAACLSDADMLVGWAWIARALGGGVDYDSGKNVKRAVPTVLADTSDIPWQSAPSKEQLKDMRRQIRAAREAGLIDVEDDTDAESEV